MDEASLPDDWMHEGVLVGAFVDSSACGVAQLGCVSRCHECNSSSLPSPRATRKPPLGEPSSSVAAHASVSLGGSAPVATADLQVPTAPPPATGYAPATAERAPKTTTAPASPLHPGNRAPSRTAPVRIASTCLATTRASTVCIAAAPASVPSHVAAASADTATKCVAASADAATKHVATAAKHVATTHAATKRAATATGAVFTPSLSATALPLLVLGDFGEHLLHGSSASTWPQGMTTDAMLQPPY
ncbi:hypothetical protein K438DRAFT_1995111 [Mycena galopus ATCC 62051]|nr:hypothetical protein K438DRAFT_1995111 [Mycena galopus ATCC 62051]